MDITVEVMLPPRGATDYTTSGNANWPLLAIIAVYPLKTIPVVGMPVTGYMHVTGVPEHPSWTAMGLTQEQVFKGINQTLSDALTDPETGAFLSRRNWTGTPTGIPANLRSRFLTDRQITLTWTQFRNFIRNASGGALTADHFDFTGMSL